ncbi:MAG: glucose 1-dehydrogenase [Chitinophagaceae bacterium]
MNSKLSKKTALITGGSSGIGRAIALRYAAEGARIVITFNSQEAEANEIVEKIASGGGEAIAVKADVSVEAQVLDLFNSVYAKYQSLDVLVCSAGLQKDNKLTEMSLEDWKKVIDVNLTGYFLCAREAAKYFITKDHNANQTAVGNIIFISSVHDIIPWSGHVNYASSKGGVAMLMKSTALELAPHKIRVNSISPGAIKTNINKNVWSNEERSKKLLELIPYGRIGEPDDVAALALFLASSESDYITGTTIYVDGGMTLYPGFEDNG